MSLSPETHFTIIEAIVLLNTVLIGVVGYFIKKWIDTSKELAARALDKVQGLEITIVREIRDLKVAMLERHIECKDTFVTKEELDRLQ